MRRRQKRHKRRKCVPLHTPGSDSRTRLASKMPALRSPSLTTRWRVISFQAKVPVCHVSRTDHRAMMSASLIGHSGSSAFRLSTTTVSMSLTGSCFFSNRPFRVKRFQTIHHYSVDVAHGLVLLYGIGTKALPSWGSRRGGTIFGSALPLDER